MSDKRYSGNIISSTPVEPSGAFEDSAASGVWSLAEAFTYTKAGLWPTAGNLGPTAFFGGGALSGYSTKSTTIDYVAIASTGNAADWGDLTVARSDVGSCSSSTRGVWGGGTTGSYSNVIDYITFSSKGNATDFGDLLNTSLTVAACSSSTRGVFNGAYRVQNGAYITIASTGNATTFGTLTVTRYNTCSFSSPTRGLFCGGDGDGVYSSGYKNIIDYITIASTGNASDFGDLTQAKRVSYGNAASSTRGIIAGGAGDFGLTNVINYVTIATTGNATDFGDLIGPQQQIAGASSETRGLFAGGDNGSSNVIQYITIATTGNSTDFGDLTVARFYMDGCSNAHGGLQ